MKWKSFVVWAVASQLMVINWMRWCCVLIRLDFHLTAWDHFGVSAWWYDRIFIVAVRSAVPSGSETTPFGKGKREMYIFEQNSLRSIVWTSCEDLLSTWEARRRVLGCTDCRLKRNGIGISWDSWDICKVCWQMDSLGYGSFCEVGSCWKMGQGSHSKTGQKDMESLENRLSRVDRVRLLGSGIRDATVAENTRYSSMR